MLFAELAPTVAYKSRIDWCKICFVCSIFCLAVFIPLESFSLIWRRHHDQWRAANFDLCSALMVIEQWGFFSVSHLLWHAESVLNGHIHMYEYPWHSNLLPSVCQWSYHYLFLRLRFFAADIRTTNLSLAGRAL